MVRQPLFWLPVENLSWFSVLQRFTKQLVPIGEESLTILCTKKAKSINIGPRLLKIFEHITASCF